MLPGKPRWLRRSLAAPAFGVVLAAASPAPAFEGQWHLGAGLGGTEFVDTYSLGPSVGVRAAYGISDMFDARIEASLSRHDRIDERRVLRYSATGGLTYKVDIGDWVPYAGLLIGHAALSGEPSGAAGSWLEIAVPLGLDYAISRRVAVGAELSSSILLGSERNGTGTFLLHVEYRWDSCSGRKSAFWGASGLSCY